MQNNYYEVLSLFGSATSLMGLTHWWSCKIQVKRSEKSVTSGRSDAITAARFPCRCARRSVRPGVSHGQSCLREAQGRILSVGRERAGNLLFVRRLRTCLYRSRVELFTSSNQTYSKEIEKIIQVLEFCSGRGCLRIESFWEISH